MFDAADQYKDNEGVDESKAFLEVSDELGNRSQSIKSQRRHAYVLGCGVILLIFNILFLAWNLNSAIPNDTSVFSDGDATSFPYTPASAGIRYGIEHASEDDYLSSEFVGEPRKELDEAWSGLLNTTMIRISGDELRQMDKTSLALNDGSGYVGFLEVHHMLHCVKRFKQFRHRDYYADVEQRYWEIEHWDHCIEVIRRGIMCNADLMVATNVWNEDGNRIHGITTWPRKCMDWDSIQDFVRPRSVFIDGSYDNLWPKDDPRSMGPADML